MIFCSYSRTNLEKVEPIINILEKNNLEVWFDKSKIKGGDSIVKKIENGLDESDFFIAFISQEYLDSNWCQSELEAALILENDNNNKLVIPILIDGCQPSILIRRKSIIYLNNSINIEKNSKKLVHLFQPSTVANKISVQNNYSIIDDHKNYKIIDIKSLNEINIDKLVNQIIGNIHLSISLKFECRKDDSPEVVFNKIKSILKKLEKKISIYQIKKIEFCILGINPNEAIFYFQLHRALKIFKPKYNCDLSYRVDIQEENHNHNNNSISILSKSDKESLIEKIEIYILNNPHKTLTLNIQLENNNDITLVNKLKTILKKIDKKLSHQYIIFIESNERRIVLSQLKERVKFKHIVIKIKNKEKKNHEQ